MIDLINIKEKMDEFALRYETEEFIKDDPVQFVHKFKDVNDIEIAGFIASVFAYGKREAFISKLNYIFDLMSNKPYNFIKTGDFSSLKGCDYRFSKDIDFLQFCIILHKLYDEGETIKSLFEYSYKEKNDVWQMFQGVVDYFYAKVNLGVTKGFYHLLPNPKKKSALKRMNMLMRWFVRKSPVDIGIWDFIPRSELLIPLDTHVAQTSRNLGLLNRNDNGYESVMALTSVLRQLDCNDPIKYDFALFGYGVNKK